MNLQSEALRERRPFNWVSVGWFCSRRASTENRDPVEGFLSLLRRLLRGGLREPDEEVKSLRVGIHMNPPLPERLC